MSGLAQTIVSLRDSAFAIISLSEYAMDPALVNLVDHAPQLMTMVTSVLTEDNEEARQDLVPHAVKVLVNLADRDALAPVVSGGESGVSTA